VRRGNASRVINHASFRSSRDNVPVAFMLKKHFIVAIAECKLNIERQNEIDRWIERDRTKRVYSIMIYAAVLQSF